MCVQQTQKIANIVEGYPVNAWYGYELSKINPGDGHTYVRTTDGSEDFDLYYLECPFGT